jgi:hypothetical protein
VGLIVTESLDFWLIKNLPSFKLGNLAFNFVRATLTFPVGGQVFDWNTNFFPFSTSDRLHGIPDSTKIKAKLEADTDLSRIKPASPWCHA